MVTKISERISGKAKLFQRVSATRTQEKLWTAEFFGQTLAFLVIESGLSMPKPYRSTEHTRAYRQRLRAAGSEEVLLQLPRATVAMLDAIKERHGLRNRSQALLQLIEQRGATAQHVN